MITLYEFPPTRSQRAKWVLEELGLPYRSRLVDLSAKEQDGAEYRAIHPLGVMPALQHKNYTIYESAAIVMQLLDENPDRKLAPTPASPERALYYQWCVFAAAEFDPAIMMYFDNTMRPLEAMRPPGTPHDPGLAERGRADFQIRAAALTHALADREFLIGDDFTGADLLIGHSCFMAAHTGLIEDFPELKAYLERLQERPAYQRAYDFQN